MFTTEIEVAWSDCDAVGIVFYPQFFRMMDTCFHRMMRAAGTSQRKLQLDYSVLGTPLLESSAVFRAPATYDQTILLASNISKWEEKSFTLGYLGRIGERVIFEGSERRALVERKTDGTLKRRAIPQSFTQLFDS